MSAPIAVILAAGKSTRMKSETPKVLHPVCGQLMIDYVLNATRAAGVEKIVVVVGHKADQVRQALAGQEDVVFAEQVEQNGTGHAVMVCESELSSHEGSVLVLAGDTPLLQGNSLQALLDHQQNTSAACVIGTADTASNEGSVLVLAGDTPLLQGNSLQALLDHQQNTSAACVIGTADTASNEGLGRVVRDTQGGFVCIREHKDASEDELRITEINTGCYAFSTPLLLESLRQLKPNNVQAEYYLTDCPRILMDAGHNVAASCSLTIQEAIGVNNRIHLAEVRQHLQREILAEFMRNGVTIESPSQTSIDRGVQIGQDTVIRPGTVIDRGARIGKDCTIGPNAHIAGSQVIADGTIV